MDRQTATCIHQHFAIRLCIEENCQQSALVCDQKTYLCKMMHQKCGMTITVPNVISKLSEQGKISGIIDDEIIKTFDEIIKKTTIMKMEYLKLMEKPELRLKGDQRKLMKLLIEGGKQEIMPQFVSKTLRKIVKHTQQKIATEKQRAKNELDHCIEDILGILESIRSIGNKNDQEHVQQKEKVTQQYILYNDEQEQKLKERQKQQLFKKQQLSNSKSFNIFSSIAKIFVPKKESEYTFSGLFYNRYFMKLLNNGKKVMMSQYPSDNIRKYALISPSIEESNNKSSIVKIKIISSKDHIRIGMCHLNNMITNDFSESIYTQLGHGVYISGAYGFLYNSIDQSQNNKQSDLRFQEGDTIQLNCNFDVKLLKIKNLSNNLEVYLKFIRLHNDPLHFCVAGLELHNEFEIVN